MFLKTSNSTKLDYIEVILCDYASFQSLVKINENIVGKCRDMACHV